MTHEDFGKAVQIMAKHEVVQRYFDHVLSVINPDDPGKEFDRFNAIYPQVVTTLTAYVEELQDSIQHDLNHEFADI